MDLGRELTETKTRMIANEKRMEKVEQAVDGIKTKLNIFNGVIITILFLQPFYFDLVGL
tara:strand:- start:11425 stop:11601 length:177 start_codon:yes stop_codon:yes gene_type:complete